MFQLKVNKAITKFIKHSINTNSNPGAIALDPSTDQCYWVQIMQLWYSVRVICLIYFFKGEFGGSVHAQALARELCIFAFLLNHM